MKRRRGNFFVLCVIVIVCSVIQIPWVSCDPSDSSASSTTAAADNVPELGSIALGQPCKETPQCATPGAVCQETCQCGPDMPVSNNVDKCDKAAKVNESCTFDQQCEIGMEMTECKDGVCVCRYDMKPYITTDGSKKCIAQGSVLLNGSCTENKDCATNGAICLNTICTCHADLPATDHERNCGKERHVNEPCTFNQQCTLTKMTECRDSVCSCVEGRIPYPDDDGVLQCRKRGDRKISDTCNETLNCGFDGALCAGNGKKTCQCHPDMPATNTIDKCGKVAKVNESCTFDEQCELGTERTQCRENRCQCRFERVAVIEKDGSTKCIPKAEVPRETTHVDPAMIGVLVGMALMFIILCVVLRLFSKARWRENRTIFNTPNPRLMNVSLLRDSKLLHSAGERRGSRASVRAPSRQPSMASLRPQSPSQSIGSRRSRRSSSPSVTSTKSPKSPTKPSANNIANNARAPTLENVTVEIQDPKV